MLKRLYSRVYSVALTILVVNAFMIAIASCAVTPQNFGERLAVAYATVTEVRETTARAVRTKRINTTTGRTILKLTDEARTLLDAASEGDERGLDLAIEILEQIDRYLQ